MKTTIKLLILLLIAVVGTFSYINYTLAKEYGKIDHADKFYEFDKHSGIAMNSINIEGGNRLAIKIEKGETNGIFIYKNIADDVTFTADNNILSIKFNEEYTDTLTSPENIRQSSRSPRVIITYTDLNEIYVNHSRLNFDYVTQNGVDVNCQGSTLLMLNVDGQESSKFKLLAAGKSRVNIAQSESANTMDYANIKLMDESYLKMNQFRADSLNLTLDDLSRIDCDQHLLKQLSNSIK